jgi:glutamate-ammonia-ligase adenylyltransferase
MRGAAPEDIEMRLDALRQFQRSAVFRIAIADRFGRLPLMKVSDRLTDIAEIVLGVSLDMARHELVQKHGRPSCGPPEARREAGFIIVAYGKLGGLELGYGSDLDLVFLHDSEGSDQETDGARPVENARFFVRLAQRLIHFLTIQTGSGRLYEVDTRLRPSGASGLLVSSIETFHRYQHERAWVWEHQALLRSRSVAGPADVRAVFERERRDVLVHHVNRETLKDEVRKMRERMRAELSESAAGQFDLKQDPGGLADIEFLVDYWVLARAMDFPELVEFPDNIRQLEALERVGLVAADRCRGLKDIYIRIRGRLHELALDERGRVVDGAEFEPERAWVLGVWNDVFAQ